jgi:hypothetical protein
MLSYSALQRRPAEADIEFDVLAYLDTPTRDGRCLWRPGPGKISVRLPAKIMLGGQHIEGTMLTRAVHVGDLLAVDITGTVMSGRGVIFYRDQLPDGDYIPAVDLDSTRLKIRPERRWPYRPQRLDVTQWRLVAVTLWPALDGNQAWPVMPAASITRRQLT